MSNLGRMWDFKNDFHQSLENSIKEEQILDESIELESQFIKENSEFMDLLNVIETDEIKQVNMIVNKVLSITKLAMNKTNKSVNISDNNMKIGNIGFAISFGINLLEAVNSSTLCSNFSNYATEYFQSQFNQKVNFFSSTQYQNVMKYAEQVNTQIDYDPDLANVIVYNILMKFLPDTKAIVTKFVELCDTQMKLDLSNTNNESLHIPDLKRGHLIELMDGTVVYFLKKLSNNSIAVTENKNDINNFSAQGWSLQIPLSSSTHEDMVTGDRDKNMNIEPKQSISEIMHQAITLWESKGKAINVVKLAKGELSKTFPQYPQFEILSECDKYESFVFDTKGSEETGTKMILITNGTTVYNFAIQLNKLNEWKINDFTKLFNSDNKKLLNNESLHRIKNIVNEDYTSVAQEIHKQLYAGGISSAGAYFGANSFSTGQDKPMAKDELDQYKGTKWEHDEFFGKGNGGYLTFKASGSKIKRGAKVKIALNGKDLYDISVYVQNGLNFKIAGQLGDAYSDMIFDFLKKVLG